MLIALAEIRKILAGDGHEPITEMRISQLVKEGMPKAARGKYDAVRCMYWYIGSLRRTVAKRETVNADGSSSNLMSDRRRLIAAQAEREELELAKQRGNLIPITEHVRILADMVTETRARLLAVPGRVAPAVLNETSRVVAQGKIETEIRVALGDLAGRVPRAEPPDAPAAAAPPATSPASIHPRKKQRPGRRRTK